MSTSSPIPLPDSAPYTPLPRSERPVVLPFLLTILLFALTTYLTLAPPSLTPLTRLRNRLLRSLYRLSSLLPSLPASLAFLSLAEPDDLAVAVASFSHYLSAQTAFLNAKHKAYYAQSRGQREVARGLRWVDRLEEVERCAEANGVVAGELAGLGMERARRMGVPVGMRSSWARRDARVVEVLKHFVRDWSSPGASERAALFPPILSALTNEFPSPSPSHRRASGLKVLVPGCGLGRLAYEIALLGFAVDANDYSHFMSLGSELVFKRTVEVDEHVVHPYIHLFSHQRSVGQMTRAVRFPDVVPRVRKSRAEKAGAGVALGEAASAAAGRSRTVAGDATPPPPERTASGKLRAPEAESTPATAPEDQDAVDLNFVQGDFLTEFPSRSTHDAVVTLFFIDTASNLTSYFQQIYHSLRPGGIWVNLGPLLYYGNPAMELPLDLVIELAQAVGFEFQGRMSVPEADYTADGEGMYSFRYHCEGWVMRKPRSQVLVIRDE